MAGSKLCGGVLVALALAVSPACSKPGSAEAKEHKVAATPAPAAAQPVAAAEDPAMVAKTMFKSRCAVCHGATGKGDGPGAAALDPKPRDYTNAEWQKTVSDDDIRNTILMGGAAIGKSPGMPASPDLDSKPDVLAELVKIVRSYAH